ncbi:DUF4281 domain-containing protein [Aquibium carbonis]|uniref:DUF4281 domain-containing protein n=1 Tax=Aquibium carbonis TaxID=2495581 RepID=A0A429YNY4_9HYPH|nr:ABA4-like family protein [Aquibium carbonis]RST83119.1 DUF4281 domain-containing protein [Aquibium carbonis]
MDADLIFSVGGALAMAGWLVLLASPLAPRLADAVAAYAIPLMISVGYAGLILAYWASGEGGFDSLDNVARLFQTRELLLAGWLHYLAFDLFVGAWIVRTAREASVPYWMVVPCLPATFLFGPVGYLAFAMIRLAHSRAVQPRLAA